VENAKSIKSLLKNSKGLEFSQILYKLDKEDHDYKFPEKIKNDLDIINKKWTRKERSDFFKNQDNLCINHVKVKDKKIYINFCEEKYIQRQAFSECLSVIPDLEKDLIINDIFEKNIKVPLSYKVFITIITKDNKYLLVKRSSKVVTNKGKYDLSISKSVKPEDMASKGFQPYNTLIRACKEELGIELNYSEIIKDESVKINEIYINKESFSITIDMTLDLSKQKTDDNTSEEILKKSKTAKNHWEASEIIFINNVEKSILKDYKKYKEKLTSQSLKKFEDILNIK
jgi:hypothetical protein